MRPEANLMVITLDLLTILSCPDRKVRPRGKRNFSKRQGGCGEGQEQIEEK